MRLLGIAHTKPCIKFEVSSSSSFKEMFDRMPKIVGSRDLGHAHFHGKLFVRPLGIPDTKLRTKFEVSSVCHFLLVVLWNQASISNGFRDIQRLM